MKAHIQFFALTLALVSSPMTTRASGEAPGQDGNGGFAIACTSPASTTSGKTLPAGTHTLDYYEALNGELTWDLGAPTLSWQKKVEIAARRVRRFNIELSQELLDLSQNPNRYLRISNDKVYCENDKIIGGKTEYSIDIGTTIIPGQCELVPAARNTQSSGCQALANKIFIFEDQFRKMDNESKAALVLHEYLYNKYGGRDSTNVRRLVGILASQEFETLPWEEAVNLTDSRLPGDLRTEVCRTLIPLALEVPQNPDLILVRSNYLERNECKGLNPQLGVTLDSSGNQTITFAKDRGWRLKASMYSSLIKQTKFFTLEPLKEQHDDMMKFQRLKNGPIEGVFASTYVPWPPHYDSHKTALLMLVLHAGAEIVDLAWPHYRDETGSTIIFSPKSIRYKDSVLDSEKLFPNIGVEDPSFRVRRDLSGQRTCLIGAKATHCSGPEGISTLERRNVVENEYKISMNGITRTVRTDRGSFIFPFADMVNDPSNFTILNASDDQDPSDEVMKTFSSAVQIERTGYSLGGIDIRIRDGRLSCALLPGYKNRTTQVKFRVKLKGRTREVTKGVVVKFDRDGSVSSIEDITTELRKSCLEEGLKSDK